jgi:hypothetical protein
LLNEKIVKDQAKQENLKKKLGRMKAMRAKIIKKNLKNDIARAEKIKIDEEIKNNLQYRNERLNKYFNENLNQIVHERYLPESSSMSSNENLSDYIKSEIIKFVISSPSNQRLGLLLILVYVMMNPKMKTYIYGSDIPIIQYVYVLFILHLFNQMRLSTYTLGREPSSEPLKRENHKNENKELKPLSFPVDLVQLLNKIVVLNRGGNQTITTTSLSIMLSRDKDQISYLVDPLFFAVYIEILKLKTEMKMGTELYNPDNGLEKFFDSPKFKIKHLVGYSTLAILSLSDSILTVNLPNPIIKPTVQLEQNSIDKIYKVSELEKFRKNEFKCPSKEIQVQTGTGEILKCTPPTKTNMEVKIKSRKDVLKKVRCKRISDLPTLPEFDFDEILEEKERPPLSKIKIVDNKI